LVKIQFEIFGQLMLKEKSKMLVYQLIVKLLVKKQ